MSYYDEIDLIAKRDLRQGEAVIMNRDVTEARYTLDQLWPYKGFVKPIIHLATPHLENIVELFQDREKFIIDSNGNPRPKDEEMQLRRRVDLCARVLRERKAKDITEKHTNLSRRIKDTKILIQTLRDRRTQLYNAPDATEYQNVLTHTLSLLVDIQLELNL